MKPFLTRTRFMKQTGGMGMFAQVVLAWHPAPELIVENGTAPDQIPPEYFPGVESGIRKELDGRSARVVLVDGLHHPVDSNQRSFEYAARMAGKEALPRLPLPYSTSDSRSAVEIATYWCAAQQKLLQDVQRALEDGLKEFRSLPNSSIWWRERDGLEQVAILKGNSPSVPTAVDLMLHISVPELLKFLGTESWREGRHQTPQLLAGAKLSSLAGLGQFELGIDAGVSIIQAVRAFGQPYLDELSDLGRLLEAPGYMDKGTRSALHLLMGEKNKARRMASLGLESSLGNPKQRRFCQRVLDSLS